jgi:hypothetical protein
MAPYGVGKRILMQSAGEQCLNFPRTTPPHLQC